MCSRIILISCLCGVLGFAQNTEATVLGGPCLDESGESAIIDWHRLVSRQSAADRAGDTEEVIDLAKQVVRGRCSSEHWWLKLAETLMVTGRLEETIDVLKVQYGRGSNSVDRRIRDETSPLNRLVGSDSYERSALAAKLRADRRALEARRLAARKKLEKELRPPGSYVAIDACPGEYCRYGTWTARQETELINRPGGTESVVRLSRGETVEALTGEVHLRPLPAIVRYAAPHGLTAAVGDIVFLLDYLGEGHGRVWTDGEIVVAQTLSVQEHCPFPGPDCWAEFVDPGDNGRQREGVWWIQAKTAAGLVGWTREAGHFSAGR